MRPSDSVMPTSLRPAIVIGLAAIAALGACAQSSGEPEQESPGSSRPAPIPLRSADATATDGSSVTGDIPDAILSAVLAEATERTGVGGDEITVTRAEAVTWNDGSLGCPEPGMSYTQALVDGYHVVLDVDGEPLDYRVGSVSDIRLCEGPPLEGGG